MTVKVIKIESEEELNLAFSIRLDVFVKEQMVPQNLEIDDRESTSTHYLAFFEDIPVATGRVHSFSYQEGEWGKIGRMAVKKKYRGRGLGGEVLSYILAHEDNTGFAGFLLDAQVPVIPFYEKYGFKVEGGEFLDAGILHRRMYLPRKNIVDLKN